MASKSLGTLTIDLIAKTGGFERGMDRAGRSAKKAGKDIESSLNRSINSAARSLRAFAGIAGLGFSVQQITQYADAFTGLQNRLRLVTSSQSQLSKSTTDLFDISLRTAQNIDSTAQVYQRFAQNADQLGLSLKDVADLTDTVSKAVAISGSSAESAQAALVQFGQALASGTLRGEELNSILEQAPGLANALAEGLGVTVGQLRDLGKEGKITSDAIISALRTASDSVNEQFGTRVLTLGQGFENLRTSVTEYVGRLDSAIGASNALAEAIDSIAHSISDASRNMGDIGREIDAVKELFVVLDDISENFLKGFKGGTGDVTQYFQTSFADSFLATAKELDSLWDAFDGAARALEAIFNTATENIAIAFRNVFNTIREAFSELLFNISTGLNYIPGVNIQTELWVGPGVESFKSLSEAAKSAYAEGGKTLSLYDDLAQSLTERAIERALAAESYTTGDWSPENKPKSTRSSNSSSGDGGSKKRTSELQSLIKNLEYQRATLGMTTEQAERYRIESAAGTEADRQRALAMYDLVQVFKEAEKVQESYKELIKSLRTPEEKSLDTLKERLAVLDAVNVSAEEYADTARRIAEEAFTDAPDAVGVTVEVSGVSSELGQIEEAREELETWYATQLDMLNQFRQERADLNAQWDAQELELKRKYEEQNTKISESQHRLMLASADATLGTIATNLEAYTKTIGKESKTGFEMLKAVSLAQATIATYTSATEAYKSASAIPYVGWILGPVAAGAAIAAGLANVATIQSQSFTGMAHDGIDSVPKTGTWLLEKGERVMTSQTSAKLDGVLNNISSGSGRGRPVVNLYEDQSKAGTVEQGVGANGEDVIDIFVANIMGGGRASQAIEGAYGLSRRGT